MKRLTPDEIEARISRLGGELAATRSLMEHPGWKIRMEKLQAQVVARQVNLAAPLQGFSQVLMQEFIKGEISGLNLSLHLDRVEMEEIEREIHRLNIQLENERAHQAAAAAPVASRVE